MLAFGQSAILPGLLLIAVVFPATLWTVISSIKRKRNALMVVCAIIATVFGGWTMAASLIFIVQDEWPPDQNILYGLCWSAFFLFAGLISIIKMRREKQTADISAKQTGKR